MSYYIIIRGPAASGKTTIAKRLSRLLNAHYVHFDTVLATHNLDTIEGDGISTENFIKGNEIILGEVKRKLESNTIVIIDACFYRKGHLDHLLANIPSKHFIFTLQSSLGECIRRNERRVKGMTKGDIRDVYRLVSKLSVGIPIKTENRTTDRVIRDILKHLKE